MADYKRMVSYMYIYENGVKKKNVGYARVEERNGECKITLHMQLPGLLDSIFPTYLIQRKSGSMDLIYLGDSILKNQIMDSKLLANTSNVMDSGYGMSDMGGILLFLNENTYFATEWDDKQVILKEILEALKPANKREAAIPAMAVPESEAGLFGEQGGKEPVNTISREADAIDTNTLLYRLPRGWKTMERLYSERAGKASDPWDLVKRYLESQIDAGEQAEESEEQPEEMPGAFLEEQPVTKPEEALQEQPVTKPEEAFASYFDKYPRIYPFEDNEIVMCVKIEPKDIGGLPVDAWVLSNNSFLLHGFYCYHHLIFAKLKDRFGTRYILGVPGIYHNRERFMARMFGFDNFKSIRRREIRQGDFGYWYMPISL